MSFTAPSYSDALHAARATVSGLRSLGLDCAFIGGMACKLLGNNRNPNDIDVVVLNSTDGQEELKARLVSADSNFYLVRSKDPFATYRVLWYRLPSSRSCKVDLLQPGIMNIPPMEVARITQIDGIPVAPFSVVLLIKLQGWSDHRMATKSYLRQKQHMDVADIRILLPLAHALSVRPRDESWLPPAFIQASEGRVKRFVTSFPDTRGLWTTIGFDVPPSANVSSASFPSYWWRDLLK